MRLIILSLFVLFSIKTYSQDYYQDFVKAIQAGDSVKQWETLQEWEKANPKDPELFTSYYNYYIVKSKKDLLEIGNTPPLDQEVLSLSDSGKTVAYMYSSTMFESEPFELAMAYIDSGISMFPTRLDMYFGKIHILGQAKDWDSYTKEILKTIRYSAEIKNKWTWTLNAPVQDSLTFFLSSLQDYQTGIYEAGNDSLLKYMREIGVETLKHYPGHVESYSNVAVTYMISNQNKEALTYLLKAEELAPEDEIVLSNIGQCYYALNDKKQSIKYYEKAHKVGDAYTKKFAEERLKELKGK